MDAASRRTAQTLIDFYAGFVSSDDEAEQRAAFEASIAALNDGDALIATTDEGNELTLDFTRLLLAMGWRFSGTWNVFNPPQASRRKY